MTPARVKTGVMNTRYQLPDDWDTLWADLGIKGLLDMIQKLLNAPDRPLGLLPTTEDVISLLKEALDVSLTSLAEDHWATPPPNPEIIASGQVTPLKETLTERKDRPDATTRALGLSPTDVSNDVSIVSNISAGSPESRRVTPRRELLGGKEPIPLFRALQGFRSKLVDAPVSPSDKKKCNLFSRIADFFDGLGNRETSEAVRGERPSRRGTAPTIASLANALRRKERRKSK